MQVGGGWGSDGMGENWCRWVEVDGGVGGWGEPSRLESWETPSLAEPSTRMHLQMAAAAVAARAKFNQQRHSCLQAD